MTTLALIRTLSGLAPADEHARRYLSKIPQGVRVNGEVSQPRSEAGKRLFRRYWALMGLVAENVEQYGGSQEAASDHILILAGHCDTFASVSTGEVFLRARSIAWANFEEEDFADLWKRVVRAICEHVMEGVTEAEIEAELLKLIGASTWQAA